MQQRKMDGQAPNPNSGQRDGVDLHMSKGDEDDSYSKNSEVQKRLIQRAVIPNLDETLAHLHLPANDSPVILADLGCSSGPNAILLVTWIVENIKERLASNGKSLELQAFFNDLPSNDFNNLFHLLSSGHEQCSNFFSAGVPGSFFDRLFPESTIHVFISTFFLHFSSKVPASVVDKDSTAFNKGSWWAIGCGSNQEAANAFRDQNTKDINTFLKLRAKELVPGGVLCFAICSRRNLESSRAETSMDTYFQCLENALKRLSKEGIINEDHADFFNLPIHFQTTGELEELILEHHSTFEVLTLKEMPVEPFVDTGHNQTSSQVIQTAISMYRGAISHIVRQHIGEEAAKLFLEYFGKEAASNVVGLSRETAIVYVALKKKVHDP